MALRGVRVLDLSRILAGPFCSQALGDMGADIIKVERPVQGDDTRKWGPPFLQDEAGEKTDQSAYFLCANRNKRSVTIDFGRPEGQAIVRELSTKCDVVLENFKFGTLERYGLDYPSLKKEKEDIVYCSVTGFGQTGPYAHRPFYDYLSQAMGGVMSFTGEPEGRPMKVGVAVADIVCGLYACNAITSALYHRSQTGEGQYIDVGLLDTTVAWLANQGTAHLLTGEDPPRLGNEHPQIVPYSTVEAKDGHFVLAVGNDEQFRSFCEAVGRQEWSSDERYATNSARVGHRRELYGMIDEIAKGRTLDEWLSLLEKHNVPCGPVNTLSRVFADPQIKNRGMEVSIPSPHAMGGKVDVVGSPVKFSETPVTYTRHPPALGEHTEEVLSSLLGYDSQRIESLHKDGMI